MQQHTHSHKNANGEVIHHTHSHSHKETKAVLNRISKIIGHMTSVKKMIEDGRDCSEVLIQLSAVDSAVKSVSRVILKDHLSTCIVDAVHNDDEQAIHELERAIDKFLK